MAEWHSLSASEPIVLRDLPYECGKSGPRLVELQQRATPGAWDAYTGAGFGVVASPAGIAT